MKKWSVWIGIAVLCILATVTTSVVAQWAPAGLQGGQTIALIISDSSIYAGVNGGGVFVSGDSGITWAQINKGLLNSNIIALGVNGNTLLAASDTSGMFISTNRGDNWNALSGWNRKYSVKQFAFLGTQIFVATDSNGVFRSQDGGVSWTGVNAGLTSLQMRGIIANGTSLFANTVKAKVFRSSDSGNSWINASQGLPAFGIDILFDRGNTLYGANTYGLYHSTNGGRTWTNPDKADTPRFSIQHAIANESGVIFDAEYRTIDEGLTWIPIKLSAKSVLKSYAVSSLAAVGNIVLAGTGFFVARSTDYGVTWPDLYTDRPAFGPGKGQDVFVVAKLGSTLFAGTGSGLLYSTDNGVDWKVSNGLGRNAVHSFVQSGQYFFAGTDTGGIYISTDGGMNWSSVQTMSNSFPISAMLVSGSGIYAASTGAGVFRSLDNGQHWEAINQGLKGLNIYSFVKYGNTFFIGSDSGRVYYSNDSGVAWNMSDSGESTLNFRPIVNAFAKKDSFLFSTRSQMSGGSAVYVSTDEGKTWSRSGQFGFEYDALTALLATDSGIFAGCYATYYHSHARLFRSIDNGIDWVHADDGYGGGTEYLTVLDGYVYAGTEIGIWRRPLSDFKAHAGQISVPNLDFDTVRVGDSVCKTIEVSNTGNAPFTLERFFDFYGDTAFTVDLNQLPMVVRAGDSAALIICFHPKSQAYYTANIRWTTDIDPEFQNFGRSYTSLSGTGSFTFRVGEVVESDPVTIFPNPTSGILTVSSVPDQILSVTISDILGNNVMQILKPNTAEFKLDLSSLRAGTYFARFSLPYKVIIRKIIRE
ncbi:MAG: T9SS type A sorting domain-containing protein [Bacteroidota bacterium]|nr:T9SS type A sorting domain-containing protein [Bacteroidota bacterium]MDP4230545.1 T9SS type A sorting domain-containing protein [Bacteroidota bacterium]MDP4236487.1 T9SS type A sorting domain-containing protein [Bacteroidota bacterium]